jgi:hypothetical protein
MTELSGQWSKLVMPVQASIESVGAKHLPTAYPQVGWHYRKCFAPT